MSFLESLLKGFIRSSVNQVGRDTGRVFSNKLFRNKHSTSVAINNNNPPIILEDDIDTLHGRAQILAGEYKPVLFDSNLFMYFCILIGSSIIPLIGPLYWVIVSIKNLGKKSVIYVSSQDAKLYQSNATSSQRTLFVFKGIFAFLISISLFYFQYSIYQSLKNKPTAKSQTQLMTAPAQPEIIKGIVMSKKGLRLRESHEKESKILMTIPFSARVEILDKNGPDLTIDNATAPWYYVQYNGTEGWAWSKYIETH